MEKLLQTEHIQGVVRTIVQILHNAFQKDSPFGSEFRALFVAPSDMDFVGLDFSGLELRVLGQYLHNYDSGNFTKTLLTNDIHTQNQKAVGLSYTC